MFERWRKRRKDLMQDIQILQKQKLDVVKEINKRNPNISASNILYKDHSNEPFGWAKGTVRGILTLWFALVFCLKVLLNQVPDHIFFAISTAIIMSYFVTRAMSINNS